MTTTVSNPVPSRRSFRSVGVSALGALALATLMGSGAQAQSLNLSGSWSGSGTVVFPTGDRERAQCRVRYSQSSSTRFKATAVCATPSVRVSQTATLRRVGQSRYVGTFYNAEHGVGGSISVVLRGRSQSVSLSGDNGATASLRLTR